MAAETAADTATKTATETATSPSGTAAPEPPREPQPTERRGWFAVAAITAVVAVTWAPQLTAPLGDNHVGRVFGRYALHLRNLRADGLLGSTFGADWAPYSTSPYAHHPPLHNLLDLAVSALPGDGVHELRLAPYLLGLLAIPAAAGLLRGLGLRWLPTLLAVGLMVVTGYFWVYGQLRYDLGLILLLSALVAHLRRRPRPSPALVGATCAAALLVTLQSWPGIAFAAALGVWLLAGRRRAGRRPTGSRRAGRGWLDRVSVAVAASMVVGVALSLAYMFGVHSVGALTGQAEVRAGGGFTLAEFVTRQARYLMELLPAWYLLLLPVALAAGLWDRRTRYYTAASAGFAAAWVVVLNNGAYIHDYWGFLVLLPGLVGMGVLLDRVARSLEPAALRNVAAVAAVGLAVALAGMVFGETGGRYGYQPADAGRLVSEHPPPAAQEYAWHTGFGAPRWLAYYWDLRPRNASPQRLASQARPDDLVVVNLDRLPEWLPEPAAPPVARQGRYALFRAADLATPNLGTSTPGTPG